MYKLYIPIFYWVKALFLAPWFFFREMRLDLLCNIWVNYNYITLSTALIQNTCKALFPFPISSHRLLSSYAKKDRFFSFPKRSSEIAFCLARVPCHAALLKWPPGIGWLIEFVSPRQTPLHFVSNPISVHLPGHWRKLPRSARVIHEIPHKSLLPFQPHGGKW